MREFPEVDEFQTVITREGVRDEITLRVELQARLGRDPVGHALTRTSTSASRLRTRGSTSGSSAPARASCRASSSRPSGPSTRATRRSVRRHDPGSARQRDERRPRSSCWPSTSSSRRCCDRGPAAGRRVERPRRAGARAPGGQRARARVRAPVRSRRLSMRIAVAGGGPGGLYFSILMRRAAPDCEVTVFERNRVDRRVRLRGRVLRRDADRVRARRPGELRGDHRAASSHWTDIDIHHRGLSYALRRPRVLGARPA